jgi:glycerophosphoryl diester phosphodiesterase
VRYPRIIAHRCGGALAPENTLAGLRLAARLGCRAVEFDVMLSKDGVPLLIHDETLERTTDGRGAVAERDYAQLAILDAGARHHPAFAGERLPTLAQALALCAELGLWANVEIKPAAGREAETGAAVAALLAAQWRGAGVVSSFSTPALAAARAAAPQFAYALLVEAVPAQWRTQLEALGCAALHCSAAADAAVLAEVAAAGVPVACYTVDDPQAAERLYALGAAAVFTDRPDLLPSSPD